MAVIYALALQHGLFDHADAFTTQTAPPPVVSSAASCNADALAAAFSAHTSRVEVCGQAVVAKVLRDDTEGSRHQRFIVRVAGGQTVLVAYNLDLAPRIEGLHAGSPIEFQGEYEWNAQGGVVHWTHRDPGGRHAPGWVRYAGRQYQ